MLDILQILVAKETHAVLSVAHRATVAQCILTTVEA